MIGLLPCDWVAALDNHCDLATDPEARAAKLVSMAFECRRRRQVDDLQLSDMLEMADAARLFGLSEHEEAYAIGLFKYRDFPSDWEAEILKWKGKGTLSCE